MTSINNLQFLPDPAKWKPVDVQIFIWAILLIGGLCTFGFSPYEIHMDGMAVKELQSDPVYPLKAVFTLIGLAGAILSIPVTIWEIIVRDRKGSNSVLQVSTAISTIIIGWIIYPFWVYGAFQAYFNNEQTGDPTTVIPELWLGDVWILGAIVIMLFAFLAIPVLFLFNFIITIKNRSWRQGIYSVITMLITAAVFYFPFGLSY